jgi:hypothetical protein
MNSGPLAGRRLGPAFFESERQIEHPLECGGAVGDLVVLPALVIREAEVFVRDVERRKHGELERVTGRRFVGRQPHLFVDVRRQLGNVGGIETASDRILLSVNLDGHHTRRVLVHGLEIEAFNLGEHLADS